MNKINRIFSWHRFGQMLWHDIKMIWPRMGIFLLSLTMMVVVEYGLVWLLRGEISGVDAYARWQIIIVAIMIMLAMVPSMLYRDSNNYRSGIYFAMMPAMKLEKYLSMLLMTIVIVPIIFVVSICSVDTIMWLFTIGKSDTGTTWQILWIYTLGRGNGLQSWYGISSYLLLSSVFLCGSIIFKKNKAVYSLIYYILIVVIIVVIIKLVSIGLGGWGLTFVGEFNFTFFAIDIHNTMGMNLLIILCMIETLVSVGLYVWAGFRMKNMKY